MLFEAEGSGAGEKLGASIATAESEGMSYTGTSIRLPPFPFHTKSVWTANTVTFSRFSALNAKLQPSTPSVALTGSHPALSRR